MMKPLHELVRSNVWKLAAINKTAKMSDRQENQILLNANENPYNKPLNRYPDPLQRELKTELSRIKNMAIDKMFIANGTHEAIDLCFRIFCTPQKDNVVSIEPTNGVYKVFADLNDVEYRSVILNDDFQLSANELLSACDSNTKIIWICSPNDPTGNNFDVGQIEEVLQRFDGIVVVDESYSDFSTVPIFRKRLDEFPNIIVLNSMNNAWGCASLNLGMAFASAQIINIFNQVKYPYNISQPVQEAALEQLKNRIEIEKHVSILLLERDKLLSAFAELSFCEKVYPSESNFILVKMTNAKDIYHYLTEKGIIVSNKTNVTLCDNCLRITVGTKNENTLLLSALRQY